MNIELGYKTKNYLCIYTYGSSNNISFNIDHNNIQYRILLCFETRVNLKKDKPSILIEKLIKLLIFKKLKDFPGILINNDNVEISEAIMKLDNFLKDKEMMSHFDTLYIKEEKSIIKRSIREYTKLNNNLEKEYQKKKESLDLSIKKLDDDFNHSKIYIPKKIEKLKQSLNRLK